MGIVLISVCKVKSQQRQLALIDEQLKSTHRKISSLKQSIVSTADRHRKELLRRQVNGSAGQRLVKLREQLKSLHETMASLQADRSGRVRVSLNINEMEEESHLQ